MRIKSLLHWLLTHFKGSAGADTSNVSETRLDDVYELMEVVS